MSDSYVVAVEGISVLRDLETLPDDIKKAAMRAVNYAARRTRTDSAREIRQQVNFPARYLTGSDGRLTLGKPATTANLETDITGKFRPTSLARFVSGNPKPGKPGVRVEVAPGFAKLMKRAFVIRLPQGNALTDTKYNLGLAIRLKPGETIENKRKVVQMKNGLALLFGPSVDQVFRSVAEDQLPNAADYMEREFTRLMDQRNKGNVF